MRTYVPQIGERIEEAASNLVALANRYRDDAQMCFGGYRVTAERGDTPASAVAKFKAAVDRRQELNALSSRAQKG